MKTQEIYDLAKQIFVGHQPVPVLAKDYALEPADGIVYHTLYLPDKKNKQLNINIATELAVKTDPPFEWKLELSFYDPDFHYLLLNDGRFVRTERKEFFDVDDEELEAIADSLREYTG